MVAVYVFYLIVYIIRRMDKKFKQIYCSDGGYWRGKSAIERLAKASGSTKEEAEKWLLKQPLYQIYLPDPKYIPRPNASMSLFAKPNDIHQSDLLSLPHDKLKKKTYKYALNVVDVASRYKGSYQLTSKYAKEVTQAFQWIYENTPLTYPKTLIVDFHNVNSKVTGYNVLFEEQFPDSDFVHVLDTVTPEFRHYHTDGLHLSQLGLRKVCSIILSKLYKVLAPDFSKHRKKLSAKKHSASKGSNSDSGPK